MATPFIRPYEPKDLDAVIHIFRTTADPTLRLAGDPALHIASYIWLRPYLTLSPKHCFVLDDGAGLAVGYILGTPDTTTFASQWETDYFPFLVHQGFTQPPLTPKCSWDADIMGALTQILFTPTANLLHADVPSLLESYPAHLHIDLLPAFQRQGHGRQLMEALCGTLVGDGVRGVHLIMSGENREAGAFYGRVWFGRFGEVIDGGVSGEVGRDVSRGVWLVRSLSV